MVRSLIVIAATTAAVVSAAEGYETYPSVAHTATYNGFADPLIPRVGPCVQECLKANPGTGMTPCPYWDTGCLCIMPMFGNIVADCIAALCVGDEVKLATEQAVEVCLAAGVWDPYWFYGDAQLAALLAAAAKTAEPTLSEAAPEPTLSSAEAQPSETSTTTEPEPTAEETSAPQPTEEVTTAPEPIEETSAPQPTEETSVPEPTSEKTSTAEPTLASGDGIVAPESGSESPSSSIEAESTVSASESATDSASQSAEVIDSSASASASASAAPEVESSSEIAEPSPSASVSASASVSTSPFTNGTKTVIEDKTVTDIVFYCPETTTVTITKCEETCLEAVTVCPPGTVTIYGECVVPEDYTPGQIGDKTVTVPPPGPVTVCEECQKPKPTEAGKPKPTEAGKPTTQAGKPTTQAGKPTTQAGKPTNVENQSLAGPLRTAEPSQAPTVEIANAGSKAVAGSLGALAFLALLM